MKSILVCLFAALATAVNAGPLSAIFMAGSTNLIPYNGTTWQVGTIAAATVPQTPVTNNFNLSFALTGTGYSIVNSNAVISTSSPQANGFIISGGQVNTNQLPVYAINTYPGYPGTLYGPMSTIGILMQVTLNSSASTARTFQFNWFQSPDGTNITTPTSVFPLTPAFTQFVTVPSGATNGVSYSNFVTSAASYLLLGQEINTNEVTGTNQFGEATGKTGF
jgi:hypothetical protein